MRGGSNAMAGRGRGRGGGGAPPDPPIQPDVHAMAGRGRGRGGGAPPDPPIQPDVHAEEAILPICTISLDGKRLEGPSDKVSAAIGTIFRKQWFTSGYQWPNLSDAEKAVYFEEFKKVYMWTESEEAVRKIFYRHASRRYSDTISDMKKKWRTKQIKPRHVGDEVWNEWVKAWDVEEYKNRCEQNRKNRLSERVPGAGPSTHAGGSRSMTQLKRILTEKEGREPTAPELFLYTHTKDHDGITFIDQKSAHAYARFQAMVSSIRAAASQSVDGESSSSPTLPIDENMIWLEAEGSKQRVIALAHLHHLFTLAHRRRHQLRPVLMLIIFMCCESCWNPIVYSNINFSLQWTIYESMA
ncbi:uncharacterized protein LOC126675074 [Mercurialis annua]|uniref:uncharacterized protein LOC126675074 n=1 Tax=Mercurialis annua TaxID=3986 RepID=UPI0021603B9F|nr:uncharacterized protein LOC126675074 [Mercurialis annua]XP_050225607.1 uncharacterized protein LOC126675074 [Mercurialis annua]